MKSTFDEDYQKMIEDKLQKDILYSALLTGQFIMENVPFLFTRCMSSQIAFMFSDSKDNLDPDLIINVYDMDGLLRFIRLSIQNFLEGYNCDSIKKVEIKFYEIKRRDEITNRILLHKNQKELPTNKVISFNKALTGIPLTFKIGEKGKMFSTLTRLNSIKTQFTRKYSTKITIEREIILDNTRITETHISETKNIKKQYCLDTNKLINVVEDTLLPNNHMFRKSKMVSALIDNKGKILLTKVKIDSKTISKKEAKNKKSTFNTNIGSFDLEVMRNTDGIYVVYAAGFSTYNKPTPTKFYLDSYKNSNDLIMDCIDQMTQTKYNKHYFYVHNLGNYDIYYLLKIILEDKSGKYTLKYIFRDNKVLKLSITAQKSKSVKNTIHFVDSYTLLTSSLDKLGKAFDVEVKKGVFPHHFINENTITYKGMTPSIELYNKDKSVISMEDYNKIKSDNWDAKEECLSYLDKDIQSLLQIIIKFSRFIFLNYRVELTSCLTISSLAMEIFLTSYFNHKLPLVNDNKQFLEYKKAYYGGGSEVYKPHGYNLYYYDVNSLYPFIAATRPIPGHIVHFIQATENHSLDLDKIYGFCYCSIETPKDDYIGLLPVRDDRGMIFPLGNFKGWYHSSLLKQAKDNGYKITIHKAFSHNKVYNVFTKYVLELFEIKANSTGAKKLIIKFLLNSLLGR